MNRRKDWKKKLKTKQLKYINYTNINVHGKMMCFYVWIVLFDRLQYVGALIPVNKLIKNSDKFIAGAGAGVTAVSIWYINLNKN